MNTLQIIGIILTIAVGIEHIGIGFLEIFGKPATQAKAFNLSVEYVEQKEARISMANQGIYNAMIGLLITVAYFMFPLKWLFPFWYLMLALIVVVALFGGFTATKKIFLVQMLPALVALFFLFI